VQVPVDAGAVEAGLEEAGAELEPVLCAELGVALDDAVTLGWGLADAAVPDCTDHCTGTDLAGHLGLVIDTWVSLPDARQA
jgi:hypothetical protein